jgi:hypothetical protein
MIYYSNNIDAVARQRIVAVSVFKSGDVQLEMRHSNQVSGCPVCITLARQTEIAGKYLFF